MCFFLVITRNGKHRVRCHCHIYISQYAPIVFAAFFLGHSLAGDWARMAAEGHVRLCDFGLCKPASQSDDGA
jgi:hypothetical protein